MAKVLASFVIVSQVVLVLLARYGPEEPSSARIIWWTGLLSLSALVAVVLSVLVLFEAA